MSHEVWVWQELPASCKRSGAGYAAGSRPRSYASTLVAVVATLQRKAKTRLGFWVVPFCPLLFRVPLLKPNNRKKGTLIVKGLLRNLDVHYQALNTPCETRLRTAGYSFGAECLKFCNTIAYEVLQNPRSNPQPPPQTLKSSWNSTMRKTLRTPTKILSSVSWKSPKRQKFKTPKP